MTAKVFLDTNVLVYAVDQNEPEKRYAAVEAMAALPPRAVVVSAQVLAEFYVTATRKIAAPLTHEEGAREVGRLARFEVVAHDAPLVRSAVDLRDRAGLSLWDALVVRAASSAGCERILTEDLSHGQVIDGVRIVDPFNSLRPR